MNPDYFFLVELLIFSGVALAWGVWEFRKTDHELKKSREQENTFQKRE
jgi:hypothetical protein